MDGEFERSLMLSHAMASGNSVTVSHQQQVPPALVNQIKSLEQAIEGMKSRSSNQESRIAILENTLKVQTSYIQALELNQRAQTTNIQNLEDIRKSQEKTLEIQAEAI
ncbi:hypothetical protein NHQ30_006873 [Ciborinia camelliae]|nr:hypothetical protein NHQ30_006873 [Ciborinia camelliae]